MSIRNRLLEIRLNRGYKKQIDFAKFLGYSISKYNDMENNKRQPSLKQAFEIADKLGLEITDIVYKVEED